MIDVIISENCKILGFTPDKLDKYEKQTFKLINKAKIKNLKPQKGRKQQYLEKRQMPRTDHPFLQLKNKKPLHVGEVFIFI
ncbi:hypothetical protein [Epilithonimonas sp.]|uniref:hypothetical protein n=1 Tax=Epilithonimonas sp. TaxID=2894511 RepID=UPI002FDEEDAB